MGCGKALPTARTGPRVVDAIAGRAVSQAGRDVQHEELKKQTKQAFGALLAVAILTTLGAFVIWALGGAMPGPDRQGAERLDSVALAITVVITLGIAGAFFGLAFWARKNPLPASIVGLCLYGTIILVNAVLAPESLVQGIIVKIIVIAALVKAIQAGTKHRQLMRESGRG